MSSREKPIKARLGMLALAEELPEHQPRLQRSKAGGRACRTRHRRRSRRCRARCHTLEGACQEGIPRGYLPPPRPGGWSELPDRCCRTRYLDRSLRASGLFGCGVGDSAPATHRAGTVPPTSQRRPGPGSEGSGIDEREVAGFGVAGEERALKASAIGM